MIVWLFLLIPLAGYFWSKKYYPNEIHELEVLVSAIVCALVIFGTNLWMNKLATRDTEYWGGWLTKSSYFEPWDEEVTCRHTKYCTRTNSKGRSESYACGTKHAYDVDWHPAEWWMWNSNGESWKINSADFELLASEWGNRVFINLHRRCHSVNGNEYRALFDQKYEHLRPTVTEHTYENRIAASQTSTLRHRDISAEEQAQLGLFEYPRSSLFTPAVLGYTDPKAADLDKKLCLIAAKKQIRVWVLCFKDKGLEAGIAQEDHWQGSNKNELVVCTSLDNSGVIQWAHVFSWTQREDLKISVRQWLEDRKGKVLDIGAFTDFLVPKLEKDWERRHFKEFSYIDVPLPWWGYIGLLVSTLSITTLCIAIAVNNDLRPDRRSRW